MPSPRPPSRAPSRSWPGTAWRSASRPGGGTPPPPSSPTPSSRTTGGGTETSPTASSSPPRTTPRRTGASSTTPPPEAPPPPTSPARSRTGRTSSWRRARRGARVPLARALAAETTREHDFVGPYVADLGAVLDLDAVRAAGVRIGVDPHGRRSGRLLGPHRRAAYGLDLEVVNPSVDPAFAFMRVDGTGRCGWTAPRRTPWPGWSSSATASTWPSGTTRTATATASSPRARGS
jgi:phosphoglucomutase